ncbi:MAG: hypothetical protein HQL25_02980 [Candidatus Omnitrophica bacterium]|nr:hypothetical protein [Candidatus Omnitrophota bacterium]
MKKVIGIFSLVVCVSLTGCMIAGVKQLGRNNINSETFAKIAPCQSTKADLQKLFRLPIGDDMHMQDAYTVYAVKGFSSRANVVKQNIEVLVNDQGLVVDSRFNYTGTDLMSDKCK